MGNLPYSTTESELEQAFGQYGTVDRVKLVADRDSGRPKGFAFVTMNNNDEANEAISNLDGKDFGGRPLKVNESRPREERPAGGGFRSGPRGGGGGGGFRGGRGGGGGGGGGGGRRY